MKILSRLFKRKPKAPYVDPHSDAWHDCYYRTEGRGCGCRYRCVYEGPYDSVIPDVPQNQKDA